MSWLATLRAWWRWRQKVRRTYRFLRSSEGRTELEEHGQRRLKR